MRDLRLLTRRGTLGTVEHDDIEESLETLTMDFDHYLAVQCARCRGSGGGRRRKFGRAQAGPSSLGQLMRRQIAIAVAVCSILAGLAVAWQLRGVLLIFSLSLGLAAALRPLVARLEKKGLPAGAALGLVYAGALAMLGGLIAVASGPVVHDLEQFAVDALLAHRVDAARLPPQDFIARWLLDRRSMLDAWMAPAGGSDSIDLAGLLGVSWNILEIGTNAVIVAVLALYWSFGHNYFERLWLSLLSVDQRGVVREAWQAIVADVGAYLRSEIVQAVAAALLLWGGLAWMGFRYSALLAAIGATAWIVPWAGVLLALVGAAALTLPAVLLNGDRMIWTMLLPAALYMLLVLTILEDFVEPR